MNTIEKSIVQKRHDEAYEFIKIQNTIKKDQRNHSALAKAKKVRDTTGRWLKN